MLPQVWECFCRIAPADVAIGLTGPPVCSSRRPASPVSTLTALAADKVHYCEKTLNPTDETDVADVREQLMVGKVSWNGSVEPVSQKETAVLGIVLLSSS